MIDGLFEGSLSTEKQAHHGNESTKGGRSRVTVNMLPDVALLEIFGFFVDEARENKWQTLLHVCRQWRTIVFGSPRRLGLRLHCNPRTLMRETLNIWPQLPIILRDFTRYTTLFYTYKKCDTDNILATLEHNDRICGLYLVHITSSNLNRILAIMQQPFPELTHLNLVLGYNENASNIPVSLLGGSAPCLQQLSLHHIPFPELPNLLLSATHLVRLYLGDIPHSGYISPEVMATCLSASTRLETIFLRFKSPLSRPDWGTRHPPPQTRIRLPALVCLDFLGAGEYFEDLVAWIDTPLLITLAIAFFHQLISDFSPLMQFISRTHKIKLYNEAGVAFPNLGVPITYPRTLSGWLRLEIITD